MTIPVLDLIIIVAYLVGITAIGMLSVRRRRVTGEVYFLAGRALPWTVVGAALFASNISAIHMVGLPESGSLVGLVVGNYEWMATFALILLALVFAPFYFKSHISTLPEFLDRRYSPQCRMIMACMAILSAMLIHIGFTLYAGATVFKEFFGVDVTTSIIVIAALTALYTVMGGLRAVVVTETLQSGILLTGAVAVTVLAVLALPAAGVHSWADFQAAVKPDQLSMLHTESRDGNAWYAFLLGFPIIGIWYWCTDQTIVQRVLGARSQKDAQNGALFAGALKILPVFLMVFPGVIGYILFKDAIGGDASKTFPVMVNKLVPTGLKGLVAASILAASMSGTAAALNSIGSVVAMDIVKHFRPRTSDRALVRIGGVSTVVVMILAMLWSTRGGEVLQLDLRGDQQDARRVPRPTPHHPVRVGRLLAQGHQGGGADHAGLRVRARAGRVPPRPARLRTNQVDHRLPRHPVPDAGLVELLPVQPRPGRGQPSDAETRPRRGRQPHLA